MDKDQNKRESIRVDVFFSVGFQKIGKEKYEKIKDTYAQHKTSDREKVFSPNVDQLSIDLESRRFDKLDSNLVFLLKTIISKLDIIVSMIDVKKSKQIGAETGVCKNISSTGLFMYASSPLEQEDILELRIEFPVFPPLVIATLGKVISVSKITDEYESSIKFIAINSDDREELIGYLFKRQRELLRSRED